MRHSHPAPGAIVTSGQIDKLRAAQLRGARRVCAEVAAYYGLPLSVLLGRSRRAEIAQARQLAAYLMRLGLYWPRGVAGTRADPITGEQQRVLVLSRRRLPYSVIGAMIGRDHSTALHAWTAISTRRTTDPSVAYAITDLVAILSTPPVERPVSQARAA